jgi:Icc-related predicted phosphoesterase
MKILSTGSLYGINERYLELNSLVKQIKPDALLLTGDLFPKTPNNPFLQADFIQPFSGFIKNLSKRCDKIFYILGDEDYLFLEDSVNELILNENNNVFNLNRQNVNYNDYTFIGLPYIKDYDHSLKDWVRTDRNLVNYNNEKCFETNNEFDLIEIKDSYNHIRNKESLYKILSDKLENTLKNKILISHFPPQIKNFNDDEIFIEELNYKINEFSQIYCGHSTLKLQDAFKFKAKIKKTHIFKHNQLKKALLYNLTVTEKNKLKYFYYPLNNSDEDVIKQTYEYRRLNDVK